MKHIQTFENFLNESQLNERRLDPDEFAILSIGILNTKTGKSKFFNVYDEWKGDDMTVEVYRESYPTQGMINLVITSGTSPINNQNGKEPVEGDDRAFANQQNGKSMFVGKYLGYIQLKDLRNTDFFKKLGLNSDAFKAYVYK